MKKMITIMSLFAAVFHAQLTLAAEPITDYDDGNYGEPISTLIRVSFKDSSTTFIPNETERNMLADAKKCTMIIINGRTSTKKFSKVDEGLALKRAVSARNWLTARGVSPLRIMINYVSADDYATENETKQGRAINQRTDIELFYVPRF